MLYKGLRLKA